MTVFTDKAKTYIPRLMKDLDITKAQASGIFGNIGVETGGLTMLQEKAPVIKGSKGGYGWFQWTGPRRRAYETWCKNKGSNPAADETNYQYIVYETLNPEFKSLVALRKTTTVEAATETFMSQNLRPGAPHLDKRIDYARQAFAAVQDQSIKDANTKAAGGVIIAGGAAATIAHQHNWLDFTQHWPFWVFGGAIVLAGIFWLVGKHHKQEFETSLKKGKK